MQRIKMILLCLAIGCLLSIIGVGVGVGLAIALAFGGWQMVWVMVGIALVGAVVLWVVYGRYQD